MILGEDRSAPSKRSNAGKCNNSHIRNHGDHKCEQPKAEAAQEGKALHF